MENKQSLLDLIAARLTPVHPDSAHMVVDDAGNTRPYMAMATLISPRYAITPNHALTTKDEKFLLRCDSWTVPVTLSATLVARDPQVDFAVLKIEREFRWSSRSALLPVVGTSDGDEWESLCLVPAAPEGLRVKGKITGREMIDKLLHLELSLDQPVPINVVGMSGAPVLVRGRLAGVIARSDRDKKWFAIPVDAMLKSKVTNIVRDEFRKSEPSKSEESNVVRSKPRQSVKAGQTAPSNIATDSVVDSDSGDRAPSAPSEDPPASSASEVSSGSSTSNVSSNVDSGGTASAAPNVATPVDSGGTDISEPAAESDEAALFKRLSTSARRALSVADGMRRALAQRQVHMEHFIAGLYDKENGPTRALLLKAGIDEEKLRALIREIVEVNIPDKYPTSSLAKLPPTSKHVGEALMAARSIADAKGSKAVQSRHLLYGALSVNECTVIETLKTRGVKREDIKLEDEPAPIEPKAEESGAEEQTTDEHSAEVHSAEELKTEEHGAEDSEVEEEKSEDGNAEDGRAASERVEDERAETSRARVRRRQANAGFKSDTADGDDLLDITQEVEALCTVLASKNVEPPVSLGLFGDWGSGKSFFMRKMEKRFEELTETARARNGDSAYCSNIVQLWFNAWHYMDTNLWASLASEIFEGLALALDKEVEAETDPVNRSERERERARLLTAAASSKDVLAEAERKKELAEAELRESEQSLTKLENDEREIENSLSWRAVMRAVHRFVAGQPEVRAELEEAGKALNLSNAKVAATEVKARLLELHGIFGWVKAFVISIRNARGRRVWVLFPLGVVLTLVAIPLLIAYRGSIVGPLGSLVTVLLGVSVALGPYVAGVKRALSIIEKARDENKALIEAEQAKTLGVLRQKQTLIQQKVVDAQQRVEEASAEVRRIERQLDDLRADRQMADFIKQRHQSTDYTRHLGVIARAHQDFRQLSDLLAEVRKQVDDEAKAARKRHEEAERAKSEGRAPASTGGDPQGASEKKTLLPRIDRIVLYIDDLDRCPEDKVVDVLQAVHLLLAFPLFVVVVGVDPRWLLHSLKQHSNAFREDEAEKEGQSEEERTHWQSTPLNYLEKIFQIPFTLWPMESAGFGKMIDSLTAQTEEAAAGKGKIDTAGATKNVETTPGATAATVNTETKEAAATVEARDAAKDVETSPTSPAGAKVDDASSSPATVVMNKIMTDGDNSRSIGSTPPAVAAETPSARAQIANAVTAVEPPPKIIEPYPEHLQLQDWEREFMKRLHKLIPSPRATKRFVNVYRLIRASVDIGDEDELKKFVGDRQRGEYQAVLFLLAILTGYPDQATEILSQLLDDEPTMRWWDFVESFRWRAEKSSPVKDATGKAVAGKTGAPKPPLAGVQPTKSNGAPNGNGTAGDSVNDMNVERWAQLMEKLDALRTLFPQDKSCDDFVKWAPKVARYSFQSGRVLLAQGVAVAPPPQSPRVAVSETNTVAPSGGVSKKK